MLPLFAGANDLFNTYLGSLKRDLSKDGFETILLILSIALVGSPIFMIVLAVTGQFVMPTDPYFYLLWFGLTLLTVIQFSFFISGLVKAKFLAANTFANLAFVVTTFYAMIFLRESVGPLQAMAVGMAAIGALFFFDWKALSQVGKPGADTSSNAGLFMILFSLFLSPFGSILYKAATLHAATYAQFLTGRLTMDLGYYLLFFFIIFAFWHKKSPLPRMFSFVSTWPGVIFMVGSALANLLDSYLTYKLPLPLLTIIGTIAIPAGYFVGHIKYKEKIEARYVWGAAFIMLAVVLFVRAA